MSVARRAREAFRIACDRTVVVNGFTYTFQIELRKELAARGLSTSGWADFYNLVFLHTQPTAVITPTDVTEWIETHLQWISQAAGDELRRTFESEPRGPPNQPDPGRLTHYWSKRSKLYRARVPRIRKLVAGPVAQDPQFVHILQHALPDPFLDFLWMRRLPPIPTWLRESLRRHSPYIAQRYLERTHLAQSDFALMAFERHRLPSDLIQHIARFVTDKVTPPLKIRKRPIETAEQMRHQLQLMLEHPLPLHLMHRELQSIVGAVKRKEPPVSEAEPAAKRSKASIVELIE